MWGGGVYYGVGGRRGGVCVFLLLGGGFTMSVGFF